MPWVHRSTHHWLPTIITGLFLSFASALSTPALSGGLTWSPTNTTQSNPRWVEVPNPSTVSADTNQSLSWTTRSSHDTSVEDTTHLNRSEAASSEEIQESGGREQPKQTVPPTTPITQTNLPIFSVGAGVRAGSQDKTEAVIQGAVRLFNTGDRALSSFSARPALIFPPSDCSSCDPEYRLAATIDFFQYDILSFYIGGGGAFNKDGSPGNNFGMFSGGVELNFARNFAITGNLNLIDQPSDAQYGGLTWADAETSILFTVRF